MAGIDKLSLRTRIAYIALACQQNMTMGGIIYGWASISGSLLVSTEQQGGVGLTREYVHIMFVIASFFNFLGPLLLGIVLDSYGPRVCSILSIACIASGCALFAMSSIDRSPYFIPAMCLVAFGGPGLQNAIIHLSNLFPYWKATATAIITGSFQLSFIIFFIFDYLWQRSWDYRSIFLTYSMFCMFNIILSALVWPDKAFNFDTQLQLDKGSQADLQSIKLESDTLKTQIGLIRYPSQIMKKVTNSPFFSTSDYAEHKNLKELSLKGQILSSTYMYVCMFFVITSFWCNFFIGTIDLQLGDMQIFNSQAMKDYGNIFTLVMSLGIFGIPVIGALMDKAGFPATSFITLLFALGWSLLLLLETPNSLIGAFVCYSIFRTFLFTFLFAYLADTLGFKYFGILAGLMFVFGGVFSLLQYPLVEWASGTCHFITNNSDFKMAHCDRGQWRNLNIVMAISFVALFGFSYQDYVRRRRDTLLQSQSQYFVSFREPDIQYSRLNTDVNDGVSNTSKYGSVGLTLE